MKVTFLVLNLDGKVDVGKLNKFLYDNVVDYELVVACNQNYVGINNKSVVECIFQEDAKSDEVINSLLPKCGGNALVLARKIENNNFQPLLNIAKNIKDSNQVVVIKKKSNVFTRFFRKLLGLCVKFLYGYKMYDSNLSVIGFGEIPFSVLVATENCSTFTKIDKWAGINVVEIEGECPKVSLKEIKWTRFVRLGVYVAVMITLILLWTLAPSLFGVHLVKLASIFLFIFLVLLALVDIVIVLSSHFVGGVTFKSAEIIKILSQEKQEEKPKTKSTTKAKKSTAKKTTKKVKENKNEQN